MIHQLKLKGKSLTDAVLSGDKSYEIRLADRDYNVGDMIYQSLWDDDAKSYVRHKVSEYVYVVTFMSNIKCNGEDYVVMAISKAVRTSYVLVGLMYKFYNDKERCSMVLFGRVIYDCMIKNITPSHVTVDIHGQVDVITLSDIVWVTPSGQITPENRSITYKSIDLLTYLHETDFSTNHLYDLVLQRVISS